MPANRQQRAIFNFPVITSSRKASYSKSLRPLNQKPDFRRSKQIERRDQESQKPEGHIEADRVPVGSLWFEKTSSDYFDGARSFFGLLGLQTLHHVDPNDRAKLRQKPVRGETRIEALQRLYYNMLLLREWHGEDIPGKGSHEEMYWKRRA